MIPGEFIFKNIRSSTFGLISRTTSRRLLAQMRTKTYETNGKHGVYNFGNSTYDTVPHKMHIAYKGKSITKLRNRAREIAAWLHSIKFEPLIFADEPDKYYLARVTGGVDLHTLCRLGEADIIFECQPMANYIVDTGEDILLDSDLILDSDIMLDTVDTFTFDIKTSPTEITFDNFGLIETGIGSQPESKFNIIITGSFTTFSIFMNGKTINYNESVSNGTVVIDNTSATIKTNGVNKISKCSGDLIDFLEVMPGTNIVKITGTGLNCSVLFNFRPQYL